MPQSLCRNRLMFALQTSEGLISSRDNNRVTLAPDLVLPGNAAGLARRLIEDFGLKVSTELVLRVREREAIQG